jgi:hypothetical protein
MFMSVHQVNNHSFQGPDDGGTESCFHCGGTWEFDDVIDPEYPENVDRTYRASNGEPPIWCPGDSREHGDAPCQHGRGDGCEESDHGNQPCRHTQHDCNCVYCA